MCKWVKVALTLLLFLELASPLQAQLDFLNRYYQDQETRLVELGTQKILGVRQAERIYLTEQEALEMALENNLGINVERHNRLDSFWEIRQRQAVYDPLASFNFNWDRERTPSASVLQGGDSVTNIFTVYDASYHQVFSSGSRFEANFLGTRNRTTNFFSSLIPAIDTQFELLFRQNLLEGFGRIAEDYRIEISQNNLDITEEEFKRHVLELMFQVQDRFWELSYALKDIEVREKSLEAAEAVFQQNQSRFEVGTAARLEVVQTEAEAGLRQEELLQSRYNYRLIQDQLIRLISRYRDPRDFPGEIIPVENPVPSSPVIESFEELVEIAGELRPEIQQARLDRINQRIQRDLTRDQLRPTLDLVAGYQQFGLGGTRVIRDFSQGFQNPPIVDIIPGGTSDALEDLFSADFYGYVLGLNFQLPIFNTDARAANAQAQISLRKADLRILDVEQEVAVEIREALTQIEMNRARLQAVQFAVESARQRLEAEQARFEVGLGTTRELIEAQRDLLQAESVELRLQIDLIKSRNLLNRATGKTLNAHNIQFKETLDRNVVPATLPEQNLDSRDE